MVMATGSDLTLITQSDEISTMQYLFIGGLREDRPVLHA
jgi:hypothetical protein